jgi:BlaI family penicillinase repressor
VSHPKLSRLELQILEALWTHGRASIREIQEAFPEPRPAYTTIQTTVYRLETKKAVRRVRRPRAPDGGAAGRGRKADPRRHPGH